MKTKVLYPEAPGFNPLPPPHRRLPNFRVSLYLSSSTQSALVKLVPIFWFHFHALCVEKKRVTSGFIFSSFLLPSLPFFIRL